MTLRSIYQFYLKVQSFLRRDKQKLYKHFLGSVLVRHLTRNQITEIQMYYKPLVGKKVDVRWHELLYSLTGVFDIKYLPFEIYGDIISKSMPRYVIKSFIDDKNLYRYQLKGFNIPKRVVECYNGVYYLPEISCNEVSLSEVQKYCKDISDCIIKPSKGSSAGIGVSLLSVSNGKLKGGGGRLEDLFRKYKYNFVVERKIQTHKNFSDLNPSSCNTLRIHTYRSKNEGCKYISGYVRIGRNGSIIDNASSGGITDQVLTDGRLSKYACTVNPYKLIEKTDSGVSLENYQIENYKEFVDVAVRAHSNLPYFNIIGWDITRDIDDNIVIIEYNPDPDMRKEQLIFRGSVLQDLQEQILKELF